MKYTFNAELSVSSIKELIEDLDTYANEILIEKTKLLVEKLADEGISIAKTNLGKLDDIGNVGYLITFTKQITPSVDGATAIMLATDKMPVRKSWLHYGTIKSEDVSPILMYEFGSGANAITGHRGTFPGQIHAFEPSWSWMDLMGQWHTSSGIKPTQPMYNAAIGMYLSVLQIVQEVFG